MIEIKKYKNRKEGLEKISILDKEYTFVRHDFKKGKIVKPHKHPVDEWVIFDSGKCEIYLGLESRLIEAKECALAIYLPRDKEPGLKCLTDISYWVIRKTE